MKKTCTWLLVASLLGSCATERMPLAIDAKVDSTLRAAGLSPLSVRKVKFTGPVTFQIGGANNTASSTAVGKAKAPVAAAPHAVATDASKKGGTPWQVFALVLAAGLTAGVWLSSKLGVGAWLRRVL